MPTKYKNYSFLTCFTTQAVLDTLNGEELGLPGVACSATLGEMGQALAQLAEFVNNISLIEWGL